MRPAGVDLAAGTLAAALARAALHVIRAAFPELDRDAA
jgi:hypothetical protein